VKVHTIKLLVSEQQLLDSPSHRLIENSEKASGIEGIYTNRYGQHFFLFIEEMDEGKFIEVK